MTRDLKSSRGSVTRDENIWSKWYSTSKKFMSAMFGTATDTIVAFRQLLERWLNAVSSCKLHLGFRVHVASCVEVSGNQQLEVQ